jgi:hypothetical protein
VRGILGTDRERWMGWEWRGEEKPACVSL